MLQESARACRRWRVGGLGVTVSVNVSLTSLEDVRTSERYAECVRAEGLDPREVVLEVTETAAVSELASMLENLSRLRMMGFGLALDDYGTGYSSMEQLTRIPFTELKIDQSFVRAALTQPSSRAILESSLEMADKLKITAVAEGIETLEQAALLRDLGCTMGQGLFFAPPMPEPAFVAWAKAHAPNPVEPDAYRGRLGAKHK
jgi:EAL domain-containing protein (putative c-di-GMP-specific phosphodiesterase class I)